MKDIMVHVSDSTLKDNILSLLPEDQLLVSCLITCMEAVPEGATLNSYEPTKEIVSAFLEKTAAGSATPQDCETFVEDLEHALNIPTDPRRIRYDFRDLRQKILGQYGTLKAFAAAMGVHPSTLRRWLKNVLSMPIWAINKMMKLLDMSKEDAMRFFFTLESDAYMQMQAPQKAEQQQE